MEYCAIAWIQSSKQKHSDFMGDNQDSWVLSLRINATQLWAKDVKYEWYSKSDDDFSLFHQMQQEILGVECSEYMKMKSLSMSFFYIYHHLMQGIKDDRFCATLTITLTVGCLM